MKLHFGFFCLASTFFCSFPISDAFAQLSEADSSFYKSVISGAINLYLQSAGDQSGLYNGSLYPRYPFRFKQGTPFFKPNQFDTGLVFYNGILYKNLPLMYDNLKDVVIIDDNGYHIQLNSEKIKEFMIPGHRFISLGKNNRSIDGLDRWFYEVLYEGNISLLKKTIKTIQDDLSGGQVEKLIIESDEYYIKKDSALFPVEGKKDILDVMKDKKKEVQQFIKKTKLSFRSDKENSFLRIVAYYEQIRN